MFRGAHLVSPTLVFTVLLSSDHRLDSVHRFHRAQATAAARAALNVSLSSLASELGSRTSLVRALENKLVECRRSEDRIGEAFWAARVAEKRKAMDEAQRQVSEARDELDHLDKQLGDHQAQTIVLVEQRLEEDRRAQTAQQISSWRLGIPAQQSPTFPPLEAFHHPRAPLPLQEHAPPHINALIEKARDAVPSPASTLVATNEIKNMLDNFLGNLANQLGNNLSAMHVASPRSPGCERERRIPGAFVFDSRDEHAHAQSHGHSHGHMHKKDEQKQKADKGGFRHRHIACDRCMGSVRGMRYKCLVSS